MASSSSSSSCFKSRDGPELREEDDVAAVSHDATTADNNDINNNINDNNVNDDINAVNIVAIHHHLLDEVILDDFSRVSTLSSSTIDSGVVMSSSATTSPSSSFVSCSSDLGHTSIVRSIAQKFEGKQEQDEISQHQQQQQHSPQQQQKQQQHSPSSAIAVTSSSPSSSSSNSRSASPSGKTRHLSRGTSRSAEALFSALLQLYHINDFELTHLGSGFYGDVFKALHLETEEVMVLKKNKFKGNAKYVRHEIELLHQLRHRNILRHLGACVEGGTLHPVTEFIEGGDLETLLQRRSDRLTWKVRMQLCADIAAGMTYLHAKDFLHRDLTSKNCLIRRPQTARNGGSGGGGDAGGGGAAGGGTGTGGGRVAEEGGDSSAKKTDDSFGENRQKRTESVNLPDGLLRIRRPDNLGRVHADEDADENAEDDEEADDRLEAVICDYGLATKIPDPKCKVVKRLSIKGHPYWMSPECMTGKDYNKSSDVFSFGVILCEILTRLEADPDVLTRTRDFGIDKDNLVHHIDNQEGPPPTELVELSMDCCNLDPAARPSFRDLKQRLRDLVSVCHN